MNEREDHERLMAAEADIPRLRAAYNLLVTDRERAIRELVQLANSGSVASMLYLANTYQRGSEDEQSKSEYWYREAYERGSLNAAAGLGALYYRQGRFEDAETVFRTGVDRNDGVSMYWLAKIILRERPYNKEEIQQLLERAMKLGQVRAKNELAFLFMKGRYGFGKVPVGVVLYFSSIVDGFRIGLRNPDDRRLW